jgi:hypothetical protein
MASTFSQFREEYVKQLNETQQMLGHLVNQVEQGKRAVDRLQGALSALDILDARAKESEAAGSDEGGQDGEAVEKGA